MKITTTVTPIFHWTGGTLALGIFEDATELVGDLKQLDEKLSGAISELIAEEEFKGKSGSSVTTRLSGNDAFRKLILVGLGKAEDISIDSLSRSRSRNCPFGYQR